MKASRRILWRAAALAAAIVAAGCNRTIVLPQGRAAPEAPSAMGVPARRPIDHIVVIFQENRTPDNLFQGLRGADIATGGLNARGQFVRLHPVSLSARYDLSHHHQGFSIEYDQGKMDGWSLEPSSRACPRRQKTTCAYG
ncbi:MAG TPA: hypothetical protein VJP76_01640, partial [Candidatus Tumulicola sp.]|nr:hypothetical protein [Candidatus Tumulicola sp.]